MFPKRNQPRRCNFQALRGAGAIPSETNAEGAAAPSEAKTGAGGARGEPQGQDRLPNGAD